MWSADCILEHLTCCNLFVCFYVSETLYSRIHTSVHAWPFLPFWQGALNCNAGQAPQIAFKKKNMFYFSWTNILSTHIDQNWMVQTVSQSEVILLLDGETLQVISKSTVVAALSGTLNLKKKNSYNL